MNIALFATISAFAAANPEGFTFNLKTQEAQTSGYAVARFETQNSFGPLGLKKVLEFCEAHQEVTCVGGWRDDKTGLYYYDATMIIRDRELAIAIGRMNDQIAIYNLDSLEEIRL